MKVTPSRVLTEEDKKKRRDHYRKTSSAYKEKAKKWKKDNPDKVILSGKKRNLKIKYNLAWETYENMYQEHEGKCAICQTEILFIGTKENHMSQASVDHCHATGKIRGLLCKHCNLGLGHFFDDPLKLEQAIAYLRKHNEGN